MRAPSAGGLGAGRTAGRSVPNAGGASMRSNGAGGGTGAASRGSTSECARSVEFSAATRSCSEAASIWASSAASARASAPTSRSRSSISFSASTCRRAPRRRRDAAGVSEKEREGEQASENRAVRWALRSRWCCRGQAAGPPGRARHQLHVRAHLAEATLLLARAPLLRAPDPLLLLRGDLAAHVRDVGAECLQLALLARQRASEHAAVLRRFMLLRLVVRAQRHRRGLDAGDGLGQLRRFSLIGLALLPRARRAQRAAQGRRGGAGNLQEPRVDADECADVVAVRPTRSALA